MLDPNGIEGYSDFMRIGSGGFSTVYRARQERFNRLVAVKVLTATLLDDQAQRRFLRECRIAGLVSNHPNIVTVLDAGFTNDGQPFIVFEYMSGGSLATRLSEQGPFPVDEVVRIGMKLASALERVHHEGVLHRDVKPLNVLISAFGEPCLTDFGISAISTGLGATSMTSSLTPLFTAPEVLDGENSTAAADIYSLTATLYALLAGRAPFQPTGNESVRKTLARIFDDPVPPLERSDVPDRLVACLERGLAKSPGDRHPTVADFGYELLLTQQADRGGERAAPAMASTAAASDGETEATVDRGALISPATTDDWPTLQRTIIMPRTGITTPYAPEDETVLREQIAAHAPIEEPPPDPVDEDRSRLLSQAGAHGETVRAFAEQVLVGKMLWTEKQQVLRLLDLIRQAGARRVAEACQTALDDGVVDVSHVRHILAVTP